MSRLRLLVLSLILPFAATAQAAASEAAHAIAPHALAAELTNAQAPLLLDVRTPEEYAEGHIAGAVLIPHDQLEERIAELGAPREVVVYCRSGRRSGLVEPLLLEHGFHVRQLEGSYLGWQAADLPIERGDTETAE